MSERPFLQGGVLAESGVWYVLIVPEEAEDDEAIVCAGHQDGDNLVLRELTDLDEFEAIIPLREPWSKIADAACLTSEGDFLLLGPDAARAELIPGAGYSQKGAKGVGRMTALCQVGETLVATGFGGQVYIRDFAGTWIDISVPALPAAGHIRPAFFDVARHPKDGSLIFGGSLIAEYVETDEIIAADEAEDDALLAELILAASAADVAILRRYDGAWHDIAFEEEDCVVAILALPDAQHVFFVTSGIVFATRDYVEFEEVFRPESPDGFDDIKLWEGFPLLLSGDDLFVLRDGEFVAFEPILPPDEFSCLSVCPLPTTIAAFFPDRVNVLEGGIWRSLIPMLG